MMSRSHKLLGAIFLPLFLSALLVGCASDPNLEGAKLDLRNNAYDRALENVEEAINRRPKNAEAWQVKAEILRKMYREASEQEVKDTLLTDMIQAYETALQYSPKLKPQIVNTLRREWYDQMRAGGNAFDAATKADSAAAFEDAIWHFKNATEIQPDSVSGYVNWAYGYLSQGKYNEALKPLKQAIAKGDTSSETYSYVAQILKRQGEYGQAIEVLQKARELHPNNQKIADELLNSYVQAGRLDEARERFKEALEENPNNKSYLYNYGSLLLDAGDYDQAIKYLKKAIKIDPSYTSALYNLGAAYQNQAIALNDSISNLDDSLDTSGLSENEQKEIKQTMAKLAKERKQKFSEAIPYLVQARKLTEAAGNDPTQICQALFQAYAQTNQTSEAKEAAQCAGIDLDEQGGGSSGNGGSSQ